MNAELAGITGPGTAFVAGMITSLHCVGMCGPLACSLMPARPDESDPNAVASVYHLARLAGYTGLGALAGSLGRVPLAWLGSDALHYLPWLLVLFFLVLAFRLDRHLPRLRFLGRAYGWMATKLRDGSRVRVAATLGIATPLLPCGPFYFLLSLALLAGSALRGAETLLAFGLGTMPLLWLAQANYHLVRIRLGPVGLARTQRILALLAATVIAWRLRGTFGFGGPNIDNFVCCF